MQSEICKGRLIISSRSGRRASWRLPRLRVSVTVCVIGIVGSILLTRNPAQYLKTGLKSGRPGTAVQSIPVLLRDAAVRIRNMSATAVPAQASRIPTINLVVPRNTLIRMQRALIDGNPDLAHEATGTKPYFKAVCVDDSRKSHRCKISLRGTMHWHHYPEKPSLRIKISRDEVFGRQRFIEMTRLEDAIGLRNWIPTTLCANLGLMTNHTDHARLFINRRYFGVYETSMRQGEPLALANGRMPGTFFKGEQGPLWDDMRNWSVEGEAATQDIAVFERFLKLAMGKSDAAAITQLQQILDADKYAKWAAVMATTGSVHTDAVHNHSYFFCANQGKLEPLPWDPSAFDVHADPDVPVDTVLHPVMEKMLCDPRWVHQRNLMINSLVRTSCSEEAFRNMVASRLQLLRRDLTADENLGKIANTRAGWQYIPTAVSDLDSEADQLCNWMTERRQYLRSYLNDARVHVQATQHGLASAVTVYGNVAVEVAVAGDSSTRRTLYPGLSRKRATFTSIAWEEPHDTNYVTPRPMTYTITEAPESLVFRNAVTHDALSPADSLTAFDSDMRTIAPSCFALPPRSEVIVGPGEIYLDKDLIVGAQQRLLVTAGTTLRLAPGVGIYSNGQTHFAGTESKPIRVTGSGSAPWACIGISGAATGGTVIEHTTIEGGSVGALHELRFKGMLSVYDCPSVQMQHCRIGRNFLGDDAVNLAQSSILVQHCEWADANADALDADMCSGTIRNCVWKNSGNDALDMMTCQLNVHDCRLSGSGDKGISVGEDSRLFAEAISITDCEIGIEFKDDSQALIVDSVLIGNRTAAHAYQKKWLYAKGGAAAFHRCEFHGNAQSLMAGKRSEFLLIECATDGRFNKDDRIRQLPGLPPRWESLRELAR